MRFLAATWERERRLHPLFLLIARTGLRLGEALALQWDDLDFSAREIRVERALFGRDLSMPKSGHGRTVDVSKQLTEALRGLQAARKAEKLRRGLQELPPWVFVSHVGTPLDHANVEKAFKRVLKAAGLPMHFTPHCLRHTFASPSAGRVRRPTSSANSATPRSSSPSTPTASGSRWETRRRSTASTHRVVAKW